MASCNRWFMRCLSGATILLVVVCSLQHSNPHPVHDIHVSGLVGAERNCHWIGCYAKDWGPQVTFIGVSNGSRDMAMTTAAKKGPTTKPNGKLSWLPGVNFGSITDPEWLDGSCGTSLILQAGTSSFLAGYYSESWSVLEVLRALQESSAVLAQKMTIGDKKMFEHLRSDPVQQLVANCVLVDLDTAVVTDRHGSFAHRTPAGETLEAGSLGTLPKDLLNGSLVPSTLLGNVFICIQVFFIIDLVLAVLHNCSQREPVSP